MRAPRYLSNPDPIRMTLLEVVDQWREIGTTGAEMHAFYRALSKMAKDLGLSPAELRSLAAKGANARQLPVLLAALGIDICELAAREPAMLDDLRWACTACDRKPRCNRNIACQTLAHDHAFCPSITVLKTLQPAGRV